MPGINKTKAIKDVRTTALLLLAYEGATFLITFIAMFHYTFFYIFKNIFASPERLLDESLFEITDILIQNITSFTGVLTLLSALGGFSVFIIYRMKKLFTHDIPAINKPMRLKSFLMILICFIGLQTVFAGVNFLLEIFLNIFGFTMVSASETMLNYDSIIMTLYIALIAPILEELMFRGVILRVLMKHGKFFAIVFSSLLFGLLHGNLSQLFFATVVGIILAYVTTEYSIKWSILLHIINNSVVVFVNTLSTELSFLVFIPFFIIALFIIWKKRLPLKEYWQNNRGSKKVYAYAFQSIVVWCFIILQSILALTFIRSL